MSGPSFDELVGSDVGSAERDRLRRAHNALVAAGPPPELSAAMRYAPGTDEFDAEVREIPRGYPPRRVAAAAVLAAALAIAAFVGGYAMGEGGDNAAQRAPRFVDQVTLRSSSAPDALAVVQLGAVDDIGNREMLVTVEGLPRLPAGEHYTLLMTDNGKPVVPCGTFNVRGGVHRTTVRLLVGYGFDEFDGLALARYRAPTHDNEVLLRGALA